MARQGDLFGWTRPRRSPRKLAHAIDTGDHGCVYSPGMRMVALFQCKRCGWESEWREMPGMAATRRGIACESCATAAGPGQTAKPVCPEDAGREATQKGISSQSSP